MGRLFILIKRKGSKTWRGAIPARRGISKAKVQAIVRRNLKPGYVAKVVSERELAALLKRLSPLKRIISRRSRRPRRKLRQRRRKQRPGRKRRRRR